VPSKFTVNKEQIGRVCAGMPYFLKESNSVVVMNILEKKIIIHNPEDNVEIPFDFKPEGNFTFKKLNLTRLLRLLNNFKGDVEIQSGVAVGEYLYMENEMENIVMTITE
jgi:hypothetical protein